MKTTMTTMTMILGLAAVLVAHDGLPETVALPEPAKVERAIALGQKDKNANHALILRDSQRGWMNALAAAGSPSWRQPTTSTGFWVEVFTPLAWVSQTAATAKREYRTYTLQDVTTETVAPLVRVIAHSDSPNKVVGGALARSVQHVVMQSGDQRITVQPVEETPLDETAKNAMGGSIDLNGMQATFALEDVLKLRREGEFFIVVVGVTGEKRFKVKQKHFDNLPL